MNAREAFAIIDDLFLNIRGATFFNPDYTLWEIGYLREKGMPIEQIRQYRENINRMTGDQMRECGNVSGSVTSRKM
jgi:nucleoside 2-deoxyribosyltransferase